MSNKKVLLVAMVLALITALSMNMYLNKVKKEIQNVKLVKVVVSAKDIQARAELDATMLQVKEIPEAQAHPNAFHETKNLLGKISTTEIMAGEQIVSARVIDTKSIERGLGYAVPKGKRAISVAVDDVIGVSGLIKPGDHVDVLATMEVESGVVNPVDGTTKKITFTKVILQDIEVMAVNKNLSEIMNDPDKKESVDQKTITLAVTLEEAQPLTMATERGKIRMVLRSPVEKGQTKLPPYLPGKFLQ